MKQTLKKLPGNSETTVEVGVIAGSIATVCIWAINTYVFMPYGLDIITAEPAGALVFIATAVAQRLYS